MFETSRYAFGRRIRELNVNKVNLFFYFIVFILVASCSFKPGVHTNDFAPIHGRRARIHTAPAESTVDSTYCLPQALCEYGRADRESGRNR